MTTGKLHQSTFGQLRVGDEFTIVGGCGIHHVKREPFTIYSNDGKRIANARTPGGLGVYVDDNAAVWVIPPAGDERIRQVARDAAMCLADVDERERAMFLVALVGEITREPEMTDAGETLRTLAAVAANAAQKLKANPEQTAHGIVWAIRRIVPRDEAVEILGRLSVEAAYAAAEMQNTGWAREMAREHGLDMEVTK